MADARPAAAPAPHAPQEAGRNVPSPVARHEPQVVAAGMPVVEAAGWPRPVAAPDDRPAAVKVDEVPPRVEALCDTSGPAVTHAVSAARSTAAARVASGARSAAQLGEPLPQAEASVGRSALAMGSPATAWAATRPIAEAAGARARWLHLAHLMVVAAARGRARVHASC